MGGTESVGDLYIELSEPDISPGQELRGCIHFLLHSPIQADFLVLTFKGKEFIEWKEVHGNGKSVRVETYRGHHVVCTRRYPVFMFANGQVPAGCYSFPVAFVVPRHIPGSYNKEGKMMQAHIYYHLKALLEAQQAVPVKPFKTTIRVVQPQIPLYPVQDEVAAHLKTCCCAHKGEIRLKAQFGQNAYRHGDTAAVIVDADNSRSALDINRILVELYRTLRMRNDSGRINVERKKLSNGQVDTRIPAGQGYGHPVQIAVPISGNNSELETAPSVRGTIMECIHTLEVRALTSGCCLCCGQKPKVDRQVIIVPNSLPPVPLPEIPREWRPIGGEYDESQMPLLAR